ncbi:unnamed protein product [Rhizophagus irregularis]|nr:unnamed protein product [Rhizophagus irregularis]CAB5354051.1 unnamed protein product [Rhizophagus irregularis]
MQVVEPPIQQHLSGSLHFPSQSSARVVLILKVQTMRRRCERCVVIKIDCTGRTNSYEKSKGAKERPFYIYRVGKSISQSTIGTTIIRLSDVYTN